MFRFLKKLSTGSGRSVYLCCTECRVNKMSKTKKCIGKEGFQRMNYLHQLSNLHIQEELEEWHLSTFYSNLMVNVARRTVQRMEPYLKRNICKKCKTALVAGITSTVRIRKKFLRQRCHLCGATRNFSLNPNHVFWLEQRESVAETLNYAENKK